MSYTTYESNGQLYEVTDDRLEDFKRDHPSAKIKVGDGYTTGGYDVYYNFEDDTYKPYEVTKDRLEDFKNDFPNARTQEEWKEFGEKQKAELENYNKAIAEANTKKEKERLEKEKAKLENQEKFQQKNREKIELRFKKETESLWSPEQNKFKMKFGLKDKYTKKLAELEKYSYEEKVKWLNERTEELNLDEKFVAEVDFEDPEFDIDETILDESKLDIPQPINVMGVMTSQPEDSEDAKLGDDFYEGLKKYNADIQNVLSNPIKGEDNKVDYEATQAAIDEIEANSPSALEVKLNTSDELGATPELTTDTAVLTREEQVRYGELMRELESNIDSDGPRDQLVPATEDAFLDDDLKKEKVFQQIMQERKEKLQQYENGEIELSMVELAEIAIVDQGMKDYMEKFLPSAEEILEMEDSDLDNTENVLNAVQAATQAAVMNDPRFQFIQENIIKEVDTQAKSKLEEIRNKYKLDEGITQEKLEGIQEDFTNWYNDTISDKIQDNKKVRRIFQEYGLASNEAFQGLHEDFVRYKDPQLRMYDDTINRYEDDDSVRGILKKWGAIRKEMWDKQGPVIGSAWNENQIALKNLFFADPLRKDIKRIKEDIIGRSGITADTTLGEAKKLWHNNPENVNEYGDQTLLPVSALAPGNNDTTMGELLAEYEGSLKGWKESTDLDVVEQLEAMEELSKYKTYDSGKPFGFDWDGEGVMGFTLEGFMDRLAGLVDQAPHMIPSTLGKGFLTAGTIMTATGVGAGLGSAALGIGTGLVAVGAMVQGAMEYGGTYMDGVRRKLTAELKEQGIDREPTPEEFMEALKNPGEYTDQGAALTAGGVVMLTEGLSDYITGRLTGSVGGAIATTGIGKAILSNTFTRYLASVGASGLVGQQINAYQEYLTEGFQEYLGQVADNYIDKFTHDEEFTQVDNIFKSNLRWDEIYESADMGYKQGELFGSVAILSTSIGLSGLKKSYIQQAEDIAYNINMRPGSRTYKAANAAFKKLEQNIRNDKSLSKAEMLKRINELSRIREASILTPDNVTGRS